MTRRKVGYTEAESYSSLDNLSQLSDMNVASPLVLLYCGKESCIPSAEFGPEASENYAIHIITEGKGTYTTPTGTFCVNARDAFLIYPGEVSSYESDSRKPMTHMWIGFNGLKACAITEEMGFTRENPVIHLSDTGEILEGIDRILAARDVTHINDMKRMSSFYDVLGKIIELNTVNNSEGVAYSDVKYVNETVEKIVANYNKRVRIAEIADELGINRSYLTNIFKRELNMSPQEFLINYRLEKAAQLLKSTEDPVGVIAASVGYTDPLTFSKAFHKKYGISPSEYRNSFTELVEIDLRGGY